MLSQRKFAKLLVETLEDRTVPATLVSPTTMTFQDVDGDIAAVIFSKPVLAAYNVDQVFQFDVGSVNGSNAQRQSLRQINLVAQFAVDINGTDMTVKVIKKGAQGNGEVHVGSVFSLGQSYGKLDFQGDIGQLTMYRYDGDRKLADSISMNSTGRFDPQGNSLESHLSGVIGTFLVRGDLAGAVSVEFNDNDFSQTIIGSMEVRGSVKGAFSTSDRIGSVAVRGNIDGTAYTNPISSLLGIGRFSAGAVGSFTLVGSVLGGTFYGSGQLVLNGTVQSNLGTVTIGGSIVGGAGWFSGQFNPGAVSSVYLNGSVIGGAGYLSGQLDNTTFELPFTNVMDALQIKGSIIGGTGGGSGSIHIVNPIKRFIVTGVIQGSIAGFSGTITMDAGVNYFQSQGVSGGSGDSSGNLRVLGINPSPFDSQTVVIDGSVKGGTEDFAGDLYIRGVTLLQINGSLIGSSKYMSGFIQMSSLQSGSSSLLIRGSVIGGAGDLSGSITCYSAMDRISILGDIVGGKGVATGSVTMAAKLKSLSVGGSLVGGAGNGTGVVSSTNGADSIRIGKSLIGGTGEGGGSIDFGLGNIRQVSVGNQVLGGKGNGSGVVRGGSIDELRIGGSVLGGEGELAGGINVSRRLGSVHINGSLAGNFGYVFVGKYLGDGYLDSIWIDGDIRNSAIVSSGAIGTVTVLGSIIGSAAAPSYVTANGITPSSVAPSESYLLKSLTVVGNVTGTYLYLGNYPFNQVEVARVGRIAVGGNWSNNLLTVGYAAGADGQWGTEDDVRISPNAPSSIDSLFIAGNILGSRTSLVQAGLITQLKLKQTIIKLTPGEFNDDLVLSQLLRVREKA